MKIWMIKAVTLVCAMMMGIPIGLAEGGLNQAGFLKTRGNKLMDQSGKQVLLRGINLGGWLIQEAWMTPLNKPDKGLGEWDTREAFAKRGFSQEQILQLFDAYQDAWITENDLGTIASLGMNCVRVPFWYRNFQYEDGSYISADKLDENPGFKRLDWLIDECAKRGIYVILDLHGAPGFQNDDHSGGKSHASQLYDQTPEGEAFRQRTVELWQAIAARYRGNPAVAAYDLLNEPMNGFPGWRKSDPTLWRLYDQIYQGIRAVDPDHIITLEGIWEMANLPNPKDRGWENVLYQTHNYNWKKDEIDRKILDIKDRAHWEVPVYVGEFQSGGIWDYALSTYNKNHVSWTTWTYKGTRSSLADWFLFRDVGAPTINPETDSFERILEVWGGMRTENGFVKDFALARVLEKYAREPISGVE